MVGCKECDKSELLKGRANRPHTIPYTPCNLTI